MPRTSRTRGVRLKRLSHHPRPLKTEADYEAALQTIDQLMDAELDTPEGDQLEVLVTLVEAYEAKHYSIADPDPIAAIVHRMEALGLTLKELEPMLGDRARLQRF